MKHFTSYYANYRNIPKDYLCIGISRTCPEWFNINQESLGNFYWVKDNVLAPPADLLDGFKHGSIDINEYKKRYIAHLFSWIEKDRMYKDIPDYSRWMSSFLHVLLHGKGLYSCVMNLQMNFVIGICLGDCLPTFII